MPPLLLSNQVLSNLASAINGQSQHISSLWERQLAACRGNFALLEPLLASRSAAMAAVGDDGTAALTPWHMLQAAAMCRKVRRVLLFMCCSGRTLERGGAPACVPQCCCGCCGVG